MTRNASVAGRRFPAVGLPRWASRTARKAVDVLVRRALVSGPLRRSAWRLVRVPPRAPPRRCLCGSGAARSCRLHVSFARWIEQAAGAHLDELAESIGRHYAAAVENAPALAPAVADGLDRRHAAEPGGPVAGAGRGDGAGRCRSRDRARAPARGRSSSRRTTRCSIARAACACSARRPRSPPTWTRPSRRSRYALDLARSRVPHGGDRRPAMRTRDAAAVLGRVRTSSFVSTTSCSLPRRRLPSSVRRRTSGDSSSLCSGGRVRRGVGAPAEAAACGPRAGARARSARTATRGSSSGCAYPAHVRVARCRGSRASDACAQLVRAAVELGSGGMAVRALHTQAARPDRERRTSRRRWPCSASAADACCRRTG